MYTCIKSKSHDQRLSAALLVLANHTFSVTVRNLISQTLSEHKKEWETIISLCQSKSIENSYLASANASFLLLNPNNVPLLKSLKALEYLNIFNELDPYQDGLGIFLTADLVNDAFIALLESPFIEVTNFFLWALARNSKLSAVKNGVANLIKEKLLPQIRSFYHHPNKRTRELAKYILAQVEDTEFLSVYATVGSYITSLGLGKETIDTIRMFENGSLNLYQLLDPLISMEMILTILNTFQFKQGITLKILSSVAKLRKDSELATTEMLGMVTDLKEKEKELSVQNTGW